MGVPALNHTLLQPQLTVFRRAFPGLDGLAFNTAFNRYEHVAPTPVWTPAATQPDLVAENLLEAVSRILDEAEGGRATA